MGRLGKLMGLLSLRVRAIVCGAREYPQVLYNTRIVHKTKRERIVLDASCRAIMARLLILTVFFCALSLTAVAQERDDEVVGEARDKLPYDLREMCTQSYGRYFNRMLQRPSLFIGWVRELVRYPVATRVGRYFYSRPHDSEFLSSYIAV